MCEEIIMIQTLLTSLNINIFIHTKFGEIYNDFENITLFSNFIYFVTSFIPNYSTLIMFEHFFNKQFDLNTH